MKTHHVLYIEDDSAPHTVSVHEDLRAAQLALREYADDLDRLVGLDRVWAAAERATNPAASLIAAE
jgi:hypothetical protein